MADLATIFRSLGLILHVPGFMALATLPLTFIFGELDLAPAFAATAAVSLLPAQALFRLIRHAPEPRLHHGMAVAALGWIVVPLVGLIPFYFSEAFVTPEQPFFQGLWNPLFESFSGFTGTGLTVVADPSQLPGSLQWWRSFSEWVGGVGVIVLMLSLLKPTAGALYLYRSEARNEQILPNVSSTVRTIWWIYLLLTGASVIILRLVGIGWWEAINHGMTAISTGGFTITKASAHDYALPAQCVLMGISIIGAVSFAIHYQVMRHGRLRVLWEDTQHRVFWFWIALGALLVALELHWYTGEWMLGQGLFQWISAAATAGFQSVDLRSWSPTAQLFLSLAMIGGGAAGSTAGGLKQARLAIMGKALKWHVQSISLSQHQVQRFEFNGKALSEGDADHMSKAAGLLGVLWAVILWINVMTLLHFVPEKYGLPEVLLEAASAQGNVGLSTGITSGSLKWPAKLSLICSMWVGRLEIVPVLIFFSWLFKPRRLFKHRNGRRSRTFPTHSPRQGDPNGNMQSGDTVSDPALPSPTLQIPLESPSRNALRAPGKSPGRPRPFAIP